MDIRSVNKLVAAVKELCNIEFSLIETGMRFADVEKLSNCSWLAKCRITFENKIFQ